MVVDGRALEPQTQRLPVDAGDHLQASSAGSAAARARASAPSSARRSSTSVASNDLVAALASSMCTRSVFAGRGEAPVVVAMSIGMNGETWNALAKRQYSAAVRARPRAGST